MSRSLFDLVLPLTSLSNPAPYCNVTVCHYIIDWFEISACANSVYQAFLLPLLKRLGTRLPVAHAPKRWLSSVHAISTWPAACAGPACVQQNALARPDHSSSVVQVCTFCVIFCGLRFSRIPMTVMSEQLVHTLHVHSLRLTPQCHAFI